jgi:hypothetical protein
MVLIKVTTTRYANQKKLKVKVLNTVHNSFTVRTHGISQVVRGGWPPAKPRQQNQLLQP